MASFALLPALLVEAYFGHAGKHVAGLAGGGQRVAPLQELLFIAGLAACLAVIITVSNLARKALAEALTENAAAEPATSASLAKPPEH